MFLLSAERDFAAAYDLIALDSPRAALAFVQDIRLRCESLVDFPQMGRPLDQLVYRITFDRRATVLYSFDDQTVWISRLRYLGQAVP
ncbi:type II toxin-antitoxin system RelE/ParE family toxin [Roseibacterium beibuensis]|uniref:type II toxin-antitoxin system RelE/ParE family toxin n=1 Tax=[Roseibacterium] beibuensis TaxID=1193142 RepID=UPI00217D93CA|nr:type II toxin-antitoxin system RelE/ParE family toxin [Roseibacterium beibuensis]MCS6624636.1 type II toxin-antitoxin system RelE/ParE family toxin [Roseibacterium beibuensis]